MSAQNLLGDLANDDTIILLRRIVKLLESSGNVDAGTRQRIALDAIATGLTLGTITTVGTVSNISAIAGQGVGMYVDTSRTAYNTGIRANLIFS